MTWVVFYNGTHVQDGTDMMPFDIDFWDISGSVISALSVIICIVVVGSVLWSKKIQVNGFNLYLVLLLVPDVCYNLYYFTHRLIRMQYDVYPFPSQCIMGSIFTYAYTSINFWINVLIAHEIYQMLQDSHQGRRSKPSRGVVLRRVSIVYVLSIILAILWTVNTKPFYDVRLDSRLCTPKPHDTMSSAICYTMISLITAIPCIYIIYITHKVHKRKLLPPSGQSRFIALYFLRISFVTATITCILFITFKFDRIDLFFTLISIEGILVSLMSLQKYDVHEAVIDTCRCCCNGTLFWKRGEEESDVETD